MLRKRVDPIMLLAILVSLGVGVSSYWMVSAPL